MLKTKRERLLLFFTSIMFILNAVLVILTTDRNAHVIECAEKGETNRLWGAIMMAVAVVLLEKVSSVVMVVLNQKYVSEGEIWNKKAIMRSLMRRPLPIFRQKDDAYYINLLTNDTAMHRESCLGSYPWICYFVVYGLFSLFMLSRINLLLAGIVLLLSLIPLLSEKILSGYVEQKKKESSEKNKAFMQVLTETVEGYEIIRRDNGASAFEERFNKSARENRRAGAAQIIANAISQETLYTTASILQLVALGVGAFMAADGKFSAALLFAAINYAVALSNSFSNLSYYSINIKSTKPITRRLVKEMEYGEECINNTDGSLCGECANTEGISLSYKNFSFGYGEKKLYENFNAQFNAGGCYAIVGESGSGKSTLIRAMLKYYDDYSGEVRLNGKEVRDLGESEVFSRVAVVDQARWIFNASMYDNITMLSGRPGKGTAEYNGLLRLLKLEGVEKEFEDRKLGDSGEFISGGENQRICLARALRQKKGLIVFDEPTNGLDPENTDIVNDFIFGLSGITRIVITHDWSEEYLSKFDAVIKIA
ncbi:MAG: ABC transporter ATP-binding protein/permease [Lachnospiraceae bacterium]|nr:ABC transporter ATP-binding protein/permease [Lachnospiraceae bacterium]